MKRLRVIFDANVLAPGLVSSSSASAEIVRLWRSGLFDLLLTGVLIGEIEHTLRKLGAADSEIAELVEILCSLPEFIVPLKHQKMGCADPKDDHLLEAAVAGDANFIVSHDKALQNLPVRVGNMLKSRFIRVVTDVEFLEYIKWHAFSPLFYQGTHVRIEDLVEPLTGVSCPICGHGFHWDFECGHPVREGAEPVFCVCPTQEALRL